MHNLRMAQIHSLHIKILLLNFQTNVFAQETGLLFIFSLCLSVGTLKDNAVQPVDYRSRCTPQTNPIMSITMNWVFSQRHQDLTYRRIITI